MNLLDQASHQREPLDIDASADESLARPDKLDYGGRIEQAALREVVLRPLRAGSDYPASERVRAHRSPAMSDDEVPTVWHQAVDEEFRPALVKALPEDLYKRAIIRCRDEPAVPTVQVATDVRVSGMGVCCHGRASVPGALRNLDAGISGGRSQRLVRRHHD